MDQIQRHRCKLCFKNFVNGKALGGHMRSHMLNHYVSSKTEQPSESLAELDSVSSSSDEELEAEEDKGLFGYGLRENPKKSLRLVDPEFSEFHANHHHHHHQAAQARSVVLQDRESETESPKNPNPVRRRSKRVRKLGNFGPGEWPEMKKAKLVKLSCQTELTSWVDPEPVSSISDTTTEEDVAYSLMKLSRDKWGPAKEFADYDNDDDENEDDQEEYYELSDNYESDKEVKPTSKASKGRGKYRCDTCNKVFKSYQALGGHRASHKKIRLNNNNNNYYNQNGINSSSSLIHDLDKEVVVMEEKIHECPVCFRVFASGQALGGHKRTHGIGSSATTGVGNNAGLVHAKPVAKQSLIDLNLPAPMEEEEEEEEEDEDDDEISQVELSAVSDGEFVKIH